VAVQDFGFHGGTLGMAAGEAFITAVERAVEHRTPFIIFTASGGARMQEGMFSLMQMPRTIIAVRRLRAARLPFLVVLTNPTTGGVTASYAMLGDVHIAEPGAVIGFAGARVIEQTIREKLPEGFQRAEYLKKHGMVDMVVPRAQMRSTLARLCALLMRLPAREAPIQQDEAGANAVDETNQRDGDHAEAKASTPDAQAEPPPGMDVEADAGANNGSGPGGTDEAPGDSPVRSNRSG